MMAGAFIYSADRVGLGRTRRAFRLAEIISRRGGVAPVTIAASVPMAHLLDAPPGARVLALPGLAPDPDRPGRFRFAPAKAAHRWIRQRHDMLRTAVAEQEPDLLLVDTDPAGWNGEMRGAIREQADAGRRIVLGMRDILGERDPLDRTWNLFGEISLIEETYGEIWVYGHPAMGDPLADLGVSPAARAKIEFVGYLAGGGA